jgi:hypothetical protein
MVFLDHHCPEKLVDLEKTAQRRSVAGGRDRIRRKPALHPWF